MERKIIKNEKLGILLIIISSLGYALMPIFSVFAYKTGTEVSTLLFTRFLFASVILWIYILINKLPYKTTTPHFLYLVTISLLGYSVASTTIYFAYKAISVSIATLILFSHPIFVVIIEKFVFKRNFSIKKIVALLMTISGLFIVLYSKDSIINTTGIVLSFIASISYGIFCVGLSEKRTQKMSGIVVTAYVASVTMFTTLAQCLISGAPLIPSTSVGFLSSISLAIFSTLLASITFYEGLSIVGASSATLISSFEPVLVIVLSAWILKEVLLFNVFIGAATIIAAIIVLEYKKKLTPQLDSSL